MSRRNRRVEALEGPKPIKRAPCVVFVRPGETGTETLDRIERECGVRPIRPIGVPEPVTDETDFLRRFKAQQLRSIEHAKSLRPKKEDTNEHANVHFLQRS